ncbi:DsbA family protein [Aciditerrimonas ferrireducens]|uniref:DsbA family protein n=1 Tax=Aciditerrimonas ferrireducens TaxID=667306 RepID=A0ABV6C214_9ACTN
MTGGGHQDRGGEGGAVECFVDVLCPFAYQTSRWLRALRAETGLVVTWRFFSLEEVNRREDQPHPWERPWAWGWSQLRIGALLRRRDPELLDRWYERVGRALHEEGRKPHQPAEARALLEELGLDPGLVDEALGAEWTSEEVLADHRALEAAGGFGVPTLRFPDGQCLFGPVLVDPPEGPAALALWELVLGMLRFPGVFELKRPMTAADQARVLERLQPYLRARDWVSIDRGRVVTLPSPSGPSPSSPGPSGPEVQDVAR